MRPTIPFFALLLSACALSRAGGEECPPPPEVQTGVRSEEPVSIQPGDYRVVAVSSRGKRNVGLLRLWKASPADSGRSPQSGEWVRVAPGDSVEHPMIGVTDVDFFTYYTRHETADIEKLDYPPNPVYPQVLVWRDPWEPVTSTTRLILLVDTVKIRLPGLMGFSGLDGLGTGLKISSAGPDFFRGTYGPWGVLVKEHGEGHYCARLLRPR